MLDVPCSRIFLVIIPIFVYRISVKVEAILTAYEDLQFAEVDMTDDGKLQNKISVRPHVAVALQVNRSARRDRAGILATYGVVPQCRCSDFG